MSIYSITVTAAGAQLLTRAAAGEGALVFTRAQLGSGIYTGELSGRTELVSPVCYTALDAPALEGDVIRVPVLFSNRADEGYLGFDLNEIGLWARLGDEAETLLAYANAGTEADGVVVPGDALTEVTYIFKMRFSGAADVTMSAEGVDYVTREALASGLAGKADKTHNHAQAEITGLVDALAGKASSSHTHAAGNITAGTLAGRVQANATAVGTLANAQVRNIIIATSAPSSANNGDVWLSYT